MPRSGACRLAAVGLAALVTSPAAALDPSVPHTIVVGPPDSPSYAPAVDAAHSATSSAPLPPAPRMDGWGRVPGSLRGLAVDVRGLLVVATHEGRVAQLDATGRVLWSRQFGPALLSGPVLLSDGTRVVVRNDGAVVGIDAVGDTLWVVDFAVGKDSAAASLLPIDNASAVVAVGHRVARLDRAGVVAAQAALPEAIRGLTASTGAPIFLTTDAGAVWRWVPPGAPALVGRFSGPVTGEVALVDDHLVAIVHRKRLESLDVASGTRKVLLDTPLYGSLTSPRPGVVKTVTLDGQLVTVDLRTAHSESIGLWTRAEGAGRAPGDMVLLSDRAGATLLAGGPLGLGVVSSEGRTRWTSLQRCLAPSLVAPMANHRLVLGCDAGTLALVGSEPGATHGASPDPKARRAGEDTPQSPPRAPPSSPEVAPRSPADSPAAPAKKPGASPR